MFAGVPIPSPVFVFDDDHAYMGGVIAEELRRRGLDVTLVTPAGTVSAWTEAGQERHFIKARVLEAGIEVIVGHGLAAVGGNEVELACAYTDRRRRVSAGSAVMVTSRLPDAALYDALAHTGGVPIKRVFVPGPNRARRGTARWQLARGGSEKARAAQARRSADRA